MGVLRQLMTAIPLRRTVGVPVLAFLLILGRSHAGGDETFHFFQGDAPRGWVDGSYILGTLEGQQARPISWFLSHQPARPPLPEFAESTASRRLKWEPLQDDVVATSSSLGRVHGKRIVGIVYTIRNPGPPCDERVLLLREAAAKTYEPLLVRIAGVCDNNTLRLEPVRIHNGVPIVFLYSSVYRAGGYELAMTFTEQDLQVIDPTWKIGHWKEKQEQEGWDWDYRTAHLDTDGLQYRVTLTKGKNDDFAFRDMILQLRLVPEGIEVEQATEAPPEAELPTSARR